MPQLKLDTADQFQGPVGISARPCRHVSTCHNEPLLYKGTKAWNFENSSGPTTDPPHVFLGSELLYIFFPLIGVVGAKARVEQEVPDQGVSHKHPDDKHTPFNEQSKSVEHVLVSISSLTLARLLDADTDAIMIKRR
jgi:hypothetical protein